jgi:hypothetical protein
VRRVTLPLALAVLALAGCGTSDDRAQVSATTQRFYAALARHDGAGACSQLSDATIKSIEQQESKPCAQAVRALGLQPGRVTRARVYITNAIVNLTGDQVAFLGREPTGWKLSAVGCKFDQGKPRDRPADCDAEG